MKHTRLSLPLASACLSLVLVAPRAQAQDAPEGGGHFIVVYPEVKTKSHEELRRAIKETGALADIAKALNDEFILPRDITIAFEELGTANAYYSPATHRISIGYELMDELHALFLKSGHDKSEAGQDKATEETLNSTMFLFVHELGHALIDVYDLPVVGHEEDAVDEFSVVLFAGNQGEDSEAASHIALLGAESFLLLSARDEKELADLPMWDERSLSKQRFYNILSLVYGSNPEKYKAIVEGDLLPKDRAARSEAEWAQASKSWNRLLKPYIKHPLDS